MTVHCFQAFTPAYVVSQGTGGPADSTLLYALHLYDKAFRHFEMGYASAMAWLMLVALAAARRVSATPAPAAGVA